MDIREFAQSLVDQITAAGKIAEVHVVQKNNGTEKVGISIRNSEEQAIAPTIYLESFFDAYNEGKKMESIVSELVEAGEKHSSDIQFDPENYTDWEKVKDTLIFKLINKERNAEMLETTPHVNICDLALVFQSLISADGEGAASITIRTPHLEYWGKTVEELFECAKINTPNLLPVKIQTMSEIMADMMADMMGGLELPETDPAHEMYVVSNEQKVSGASAIMYNDGEPLVEVCERMGVDSVYIIPSSIHEVIVVNPAMVTPEDLRGMIGEVNGTEVAEDEQLSDNAYVFYKDTRELEIAN